MPDVTTTTVAWLTGVAFGASIVFAVQGAERVWQKVRRRDQDIPDA